MSRGCCTHQNVFVAARNAARENKCGEWCGELARKNSHQPFIRGAVHRRRGHAHEQAAVTHASYAFWRSAWPYAQTQDEIGALNGAPGGCGSQGRSFSNAIRMMLAQSGDRSIPPIGGMMRRNGRRTGSHSEVRIDCTGE